MFYVNLFILNYLEKLRFAYRNKDDIYSDKNTIIQTDNAN